VAERSNTLEGGTDGVTLTQAVGGNTGGASGDFFDVVTTGGSVGHTFSNLQARGALSMRIAQPTTFASTRVDWTALGAFTTDVWTRQYLYFPANPLTNKVHIWAARTSGALCAQMAITTAGLVEPQNAAGAAIASGTGAVAVPLNQWFRIETRTVPSATVGVFEWWLYNTADSATHTETNVQTGLVLAANIDVIRLGQITTPGPTGSFLSYHDNMAVSSTAKLGPATAATFDRPLRRFPLGV
jgi:hypothetical protein